MNMYEFNQAGYSGLPNYTDSDFFKANKDILEYLKNHSSKYYMLLNNDEHYYTLFTFKDNFKFKEMSMEIIDIIKELGNVKSIELTEDGNAIEAWIMYNGQCQVFYLFNYERGVIEV